MAENLTTMYWFKYHANIALTTTTDDTLIPKLIEEVSAAMGKRCARVWTNTERRLWLDGTGRDFITVPDFPITRILGVSIQTVNALKITNTTAQWASVAVRDGTMYLNSVNTSGTAASEIEIAFSSYKTISTLATQIDAQTGWDATVESNMGNWSTQLIRPVDCSWSADGGYARLEIADLPSPARVRSESNQQIELADSPDAVRGLPLRRTFPPGTSNIMVWYKAGYTLPSPYNTNTAPTTAGNVPDDLTLLCNNITKSVYETTKQKTGAMKSEKFDNYSYTMGDGSSRAIIAQAIEDHREQLMNYVSSRLV